MKKLSFAPVFVALISAPAWAAPIAMEDQSQLKVPAAVPAATAFQPHQER